MGSIRDRLFVFLKYAATCSAVTILMVYYVSEASEPQNHGCDTLNSSSLARVIRDTNLTQPLSNSAVVLTNAGYQESCMREPIDSCDPLKFLVCGKNYLCDCPDPSTQYFDFYSQECKIKAGQVCYKAPGIGCTSNSVCELEDTIEGPRLRCRCDDGIQPTKQGKCMLLHGQECDPGQDLCDRDGYLECDPVLRTCRCENPGRSWFDPSVQQCFLLANTTCVPQSVNATAQTCVINSECILDSATGNGTCVCNRGSTQDRFERCFLPYGHKCSGINDYCNTAAFLSCNLDTYTCDCTNPEDTIYDSGTNQCRIRATGECDPSPGSQMCVDKASCLRQDWGQSYCTCHVGLLPGAKGLCIKRHAQQCAYDESDPDRCDPHGYQVCKDGICMCENPLHMIYNKTDRSCHITLNNPCNSASAPCDQHLKCINGTCICDPDLGLVDNGSGTCSKSYGASCSSLQGDVPCDSKSYLECQANQCKCMPGYQEVPPGQSSIEGSVSCIGGYKSTCQDNSHCNRNASLVCDAKNECRCYIPDEQVFDESLGKCTGKLHGRCLYGNGSSTPVPMECADGLTCVRVAGNSFYGTCEPPSQCLTNPLLDECRGVRSKSGASFNFTVAIFLTSVVYHMVFVWVS